MMEDCDTGNQTVKISMSLAIEGLIEVCQMCLKTFLDLEFDNSEDKCQVISDAVENVKHLTETVKNIFDQILFTDTTTVDNNPLDSLEICDENSDDEEPSPRKKDELQGESEESLVIKHQEDHEDVKEEIATDIPKDEDGETLSSISSSKVCKVFPCTECEESFPNNRELNKHLKKIHSIGRFQCKECGMGFPENYQLQRHFVRHSGQRNFACDQCDKTYKSAFLLKEHKYIHTGERPYECNKLSLFNTHKRMHEGRIKDRKKLHCDQCEFMTPDRNLLVEHKWGHSGLRPLVCDICQKTFGKKSILRSHKLTHSQEKLFSCDQCGKSFKCKVYLKIHIKTLHTHQDDRPFACGQCDATFKKQGTLLGHVKAIHKGIKENVCDECGKPFAKLYDLKLHQQSHLDKRPYACDLCTNSFADQQRLRRHKEIHKVWHRNPHGCSSCYKSYIRVRDLKKHVQLCHADCNLSDSIGNPDHKESRE